MKLRTIITACARAGILGAWCALLGAGCATSGGKQAPSTDGYGPQYARLHWTVEPEIVVSVTRVNDRTSFGAWRPFRKRERSNERALAVPGAKLLVDLRVMMKDKTTQWFEGILEDWEVVLEGGKDYTLRFERSAAVADTARFIEVWIEEAGSGAPVTDKWIIGAGLWQL